MIYEIKDPKAVQRLFAGREETMVLSCLHGVMGRILASHPKRPRSAAAVLGDFVCLAGHPNAELIAVCRQGHASGFAILVPPTLAWERMIERCCGEKAHLIVRHAMRSEGFDAERLRALARKVPVGYLLHPIDEALYHRCLEQDWSRDLVGQYPDYESYRALGLGVAALRGGRPVAGASSYSSYPGGIEIEIDSSEPYRRRGLATACGAALILACLERGVTPHWDAHDLRSVALAEKLGYKYGRSYTAYEVYG